MFGNWQSFYQMTGEAAATLIGLLFIVVSLTAGRPMPTTVQGVALCTTPTVFHLVSVLVISALDLAPDGEGDSRTAIMLAWAVFGLVHTIAIALRIRRLPNQAHWSDFWWYGAAPACIYLALASANFLAWAEVAHAAYFLGLCVLALLRKSATLTLTTPALP
jgi:hypothetical protein